MFNEELEFDPQLRADTVAKAAHACDNAVALARVTDDLDNTLESMSFGIQGTRVGCLMELW